jgi:hypothetical protein
VRYKRIALLPEHFKHPGVEYTVKYRVALCRELLSLRFERHRFS